MTTFHIQRKKKILLQKTDSTNENFYFQRRKKNIFTGKKNNLNVSGKIIFLPVKNPFFSSLKIKSFEWLD